MARITAPRRQGTIYDQADAWTHRLDAGEERAAQEMLGAWTDVYWAVRRDMEDLAEKVARARAEGRVLSPAWLYQERRMTRILDTARREVARFAQVAASQTEAVQAIAADVGRVAAHDLAEQAVHVTIPEAAAAAQVTASMTEVDPNLARQVVGFMGDGGVLREHLSKTLPDETVDRIRSTLVRGILTGRSGDWMIQQVAQDVALTYARAETIMRTESIRVYRHASRETYRANREVVGTWVWTATLDSRTCIACILMHGTEHAVDSIQDGHPRCRCAMVPRTRTWEDILGPDLAGDGPWEDTRPALPSGSDWFQAQPPGTQRDMLGPEKYRAWQDGEFGLDDLVARTHSPRWGTQRTERSLKAIREGRNANWYDEPDAR